MGNRKSIISYGLSFTMCVFLALFSIGSGCYFGFLSDASLSIAFRESEAFEAIREDVLNGVDYSAAPDSLDRLVIESIITKDMVWADVAEYINSKYGKRDFEPDLEAFENSYYGNISYMMAEKGILIDSVLESAIDGYYSQLKDYYITALNNVNISAFTAINDNYGHSIIFMAAIGAIGILFIGVCIYFTVESVKDRLRFYSFSLISAGIITSAIPLYLLVVQTYLNIKVFPQYMYNLTVTFLRNGLITVNGFGIFMIVAGIICAVVDITAGSKE